MIKQDLKYSVHISTLIDGEMMQHCDGAWLVTAEIKIEKAKLLQQMTFFCLEQSTLKVKKHHDDKEH